MNWPLQLQLVGLGKCYGIYQEEKKRLRVRSSHYKKSFLKTFLKFTGKHLCWGLLFNNVASQITSSCHPKQLFFLNVGHSAYKKDQSTNFGSTGIFVCLCRYDYIFLVFYRICCCCFFYSQGKYNHIRVS